MTQSADLKCQMYSEVHSKFNYTGPSINITVFNGLYRSDLNSRGESIIGTDMPEISQSWTEYGRKELQPGQQKWEKCPRTCKTEMRRICG